MTSRTDRPLSAEKQPIDYQELYHQAMDAYRKTKMEHGLCKPVERKACTHCAGVRKLDELLSKYKGRPVRLA